MLDTAEHSLDRSAQIAGERRRRELVLHLAQNVARARQDAGLTQHQLARVAELSRATIHLIEAGACDPRLSTVTRLAAALRLDPIKLFEAPHPLS